MRLTRRETLKLLAATAAGTAVLPATQRLALALTGRRDHPTVIWLNAGGPDLGLLPMLGQHVPNFLELVSLKWDVQAFDAVLPQVRGTAPEALGAAPIIVVETLPPRGALQGTEETPFQQRLGTAKAAVLLGTEACYGGLTTDAEAVAAFTALCRRLNTPLIRLPGVPPPPQHLVGVLAHLEYFGFPALDSHGRPLLYYGQTVCTACERRADLDSGRFAAAFGQPGCLLKLGCKGLVTYNTCSTARWNNGENWCVGAGGPCTGCSEPGFPDHGGVGLYGRLIGGAEGVRPRTWSAVEQIGYGLLGLAGVGLGLQAVRRWLAPDPAPARHPPTDER